MLAHAIHAALNGASSAVLAVDGWDPDLGERARTLSENTGNPVLPVHSELGAVWIGPLEIAGETGCWHCFALRRRRALRQPDEYGKLLSTQEKEMRRPSGALTPLAADSVITLLEQEIATPHTHNAIMKLDLTSLTVTRHTFLPDPLCPECGNLPTDKPTELTFAPHPKLAPNNYRARDIMTEFSALEKLYVDPECGLVREISSRTQAGVLLAAAPIRLRLHEHQLELGIGRGNTRDNSALIALFEALERFGGMLPGGQRTVINGSAASIGHPVLDPRTLGTHLPESYARTGFGYRPFHEHAECAWIWAYSCAREAPILVPEKLGYYGLPSHEERPFLFESSNGCALGSSIEEAVLHGLLEVLERDAFLLTWYAGLSVPELDLTAVTDRTISFQAAAIELATGYRVRVFDTTMEHGIPSTWATACARTSNGPQVICAAGSSLDPEKAILNALTELGPIVPRLIRDFDPQLAAQMAQEPELVCDMSDHAMLYGDPDAAQRLAFLLDNAGPPRPPLPPHYQGTDLTEDLRTMLNQVHAAGLDVIVVDQTTEEHRAGGLNCVKVLVPGALPMTFGHLNRRTHGLPRLHAVPALLGYQSSSPNPHPHPFP